MNYLLRFLLCAVLPLGGCRHEPVSEPFVPSPNPPDTVASTPYNILCLGDSYTKGQGVDWNLNFPNQLADSLIKRAYKVTAKAPHVIAQTGWRTDQLQKAINNDLTIKDSVFSLVTLCIGVNNQYQNGNFETYKTQFTELLNTAIQFAGGKKEKVLVLSIPDWAYTPYGQNFGDPAIISEKIDLYNAANKTITNTFGIKYVSVTEISRRGLVETNLVATDGLHPSAIQYSKWVGEILK
jgi:acyl-CoA thioesterase I